MFPCWLPVSSRSVSGGYMKRWKPSAPLAQIPLCTHKHRNSSKITKKKQKKAGTFSHPRDPKSFPNELLRRNVFRKGEVWRSLLGLVHRSLVKKSLWWTVCVCVLFSLHICVYLHVCVRAKGGRGVEAGGESLMRNRCLSASSAWARRPR